ncbi:AAA family ATPase [Bradyrhizobium sp. ISRA443]|uniref:ATP-binding protein n=1 Tax=unclassified Bradyrhizobium TaxID=2631580 RepID=UPI002479FB62|nr:MULTISPECIES: AAA family ATPase [unclassified Bradyrhizobium]WGR92307.1 AAA family ATPase [Bradyrhizobium sp. ISRA435]WGR96641.1 AAA family ATPase [Bradyrhizobium sp. ISRA436]WGS03528.1 AAA family ATPase [Bradyrhizobium sp. ISRA437]WGS10412.1 AAA family ATPase [Bradyrhizobium sp. ISRA443]
MTEHRFQIRSLSFHGPAREAASVSFGAGLNVIYGASNTGKSFIVDAIDFMLGGKGPLRDIPERVGYDKVILGIETLSGAQFSFLRSTAGGNITRYEGLYSDTLPEGQGTLLADTHSERKEDNLSAFLLSQLDLMHRKVRRNQRGDVQSLSFRNLARLIIVNEEEIIQQRSPLSDGNYVADTANSSVFKLLLTGVDDSALAAAKHQTPEYQARGAQLDLLDQLIGDYRKKVRELAGPPAELEDQLSRLDTTMGAHGQQLAISESQYRGVANERRTLLKRLEDGRNRLTEIRNLLERFELLEQHYRSDVDRLRGIEEAGNLFSALGEATCPLCGAAPEHHRPSSDCDGNIEGAVAAAHAEISKIELRQGELRDTIATLQREARAFERRFPGIEQSISRLSEEIDNIVAPNLRRLRSSYRDLADKRGEVKEALGLHQTLKDLEERKGALEREDAAALGSPSNATEIELSTTTVDKFSSVVLELLKQWHFPDADRVHFDMKVRDLIINGKNRTSFGKGLRAITQAAFTIGLLEFCARESTPHPGFAVLDSPLLSYREPEGTNDDLRGTDLDDHFYDLLQSARSDRQIIVIENTDPPANVRASPQALKFTGIAGIGRFGLFPVS